MASSLSTWWWRVRAVNALGNLTRWPRHFLGRPRQSPSSHDEVRALSTVLTASKPARALHRGPPPPPTALCLDPKHSKIAPLEGERGVGWGNLGNFPGRAEIPRAPARVPFFGASQLGCPGIAPRLHSFFATGTSLPDSPFSPVPNQCLVGWDEQFFSQFRKNSVFSLRFFLSMMFSLMRWEEAEARAALFPSMLADSQRSSQFSSMENCKRNRTILLVPCAKQVLHFFLYGHVWTEVFSGKKNSLKVRTTLWSHLVEQVQVPVVEEFHEGFQGTLPFFLFVQFSSVKNPPFAKTKKGQL